MNKHEVVEKELYIPEGKEAENRIADVTGNGDFVMIHNELLNSRAFKELSVTAKASYLYYRLGVMKRTFPVYVRLKLTDAIDNGLFSSKETSVKVKMELVENGLLSQVIDNNGIISHTLKLSERWKWYGTEHFCHVKYDTGNYDNDH